MKKFIPVFLSVIVTLSLFTPLSTQAATFPDVPKNFWAYHQINFVSNAGWMSGKPDGKFHPNEPITRGQFALILYTFARKSFDAYAEKNEIWRDFPPQFVDVDSNTKLGKAVGLLSYYKIANGYPDGTFRPNEPITRGQMAVMLSRFYWGSEEANRRAKLQQNEPLPFKDPIPSAQRGYICQVFEFGWMGGTSKTTFSAQKKVTRAQAAVIMYNLVHKTTETLYWKDGTMRSVHYQ
jgi:hypothetical protein